MMHRIYTGTYSYEPDLVGAIDYGLYQQENEIPCISEMALDNGNHIWLTKKRLNFQIGERFVYVQSLYLNGYMDSLGRLHMLGIGYEYPRKIKKFIKNKMRTALELKQGKIECTR